MFLAVSAKMRAMAMVSSNDTEGWQRVREAILRRRLEFDLTQEEAAERAGIAASSWRAVESSDQQSFRAITLSRMAGALDWPPDAIIKLLAHIEPEPVSSDLDWIHDERINGIEARLDSLAEAVQAVVAHLGLPLEVEVPPRP